jgi:hypothetical protein
LHDQDFASLRLNLGFQFGELLYVQARIEHNFVAYRIHIEIEENDVTRVSLGIKILKQQANLALMLEGLPLDAQQFRKTRRLSPVGNIEEAGLAHDVGNLRFRPVLDLPD